MFDIKEHGGSYGGSGRGKLISKFEPGFFEKVYETIKMPPAENYSNIFTAEYVPTNFTHSFVDKESGVVYTATKILVTKSKSEGGTIIYKDFASFKDANDDTAPTKVLRHKDFLIVLTGTYVYVLNDSDFSRITSFKVPSVNLTDTNTTRATDAIVLGDKLYVVTKRGILCVYDLESFSIIHQDDPYVGLGIVTTGTSYNWPASSIGIDSVTGELYVFTIFGHSSGFHPGILTTWDPITLEKRSVGIPSYISSSKKIGDPTATELVDYPYLKKEGDLLFLIISEKRGLYVKDSNKSGDTPYSTIYESVTPTVPGGRERFALNEQTNLVSTDSIEVIHNDVLDPNNVNHLLKYLKSNHNAHEEVRGIGTLRGTIRYAYSDGPSYTEGYTYGGTANAYKIGLSTRKTPIITKVVEDVIGEAYTESTKRDPILLVNKNHFFACYPYREEGAVGTFLKVVKVDKRTKEKSTHLIREDFTSPKKLYGEELFINGWSQTPFVLHKNLLVFAVMNKLYVYDTDDFSLKYSKTLGDATQSVTSYIYFDVRDDALAIKRLNTLVYVDLKNFTERWQITPTTGATATIRHRCFILDSGQVGVQFSTGIYTYNPMDGSRLGFTSSISTESMYLRSKNKFIYHIASEAFGAYDAKIQSNIGTLTSSTGIEKSFSGSWHVFNSGGLDIMINTIKTSSGIHTISAIDTDSKTIKTAYHYIDGKLDNNAMALANQMYDMKLYSFNGNCIYEYDFDSIVETEIKELKGYKIK